MSIVYNLFLTEIEKSIKPFKKIENGQDKSNNIDHKEYLDRMIYNVLMNFNVCLKITNTNYKIFRCVIRPTTIKILEYNDTFCNLVNNLISFDDLFGDGKRSYHFVKSAYYDAHQHLTVIKIYPAAPSLNKYDIIECDVMINGYFGDKLHQLSSLLFIERNELKCREIMTSILNPATYIDGDYANNINGSRELEDKCNLSQYTTIYKMKNNIEIIHGPPGTGKSTTIANIIRHKIPLHHNILCTAVQNQAIESLVTKLHGLKFIVIGNEDRLQIESKKYTFESMCINNKIIQKNIHDRIKLLQKIDKLLESGYDDISPTINKLQIKLTTIDNLIAQEKHKILDPIRIIICTIATSHRIYRIMKKTIHTVILDEAGATVELDIPSLIRLMPLNMILIGDHKQLKGFCNVPNYLTDNNMYDVSMMERLLKGNRQFHLLTIQYRMHDDLCNIVSELFYDGLLISDKSCHNNTSNETIEWINVIGLDKRTNNGSFFNVAELNSIKSLCQKHRDQNILILAPYLAQLHYLQDSITDSNVNIRTIDSAQGMECEIVIISLVRSNNKGNIGFLDNINRMCVMISRAKHKLYIVGNYKMYAECSNVIWNKFTNMVKVTNQISEYKNLISNNK